MTPPQRGLGRGLSALIPESGSVTAGSFREIAVSNIVPNSFQPRETFDEGSLEELVSSISQLGVLQPILVRNIEDNKYEIIAGERRWRAAKRAGLESIPALIRDAPDQRSLEEALVENLQRDDLNPMEEAFAFSRLAQFGLTQQEIANRVGRSRPAIANSLRLLQLSPKVQNLLVAKDLSSGHARALLSVSDTGKQLSLAQKASNNGWSVRQLEEHIRSKANGKQIKDAKGARNGTLDDGSAKQSAALIELENLLAEYLSTSVKVLLGEGKGKLTVDFADLDDLERIYRRVVT